MSQSSITILIFLLLLLGPRASLAEDSGLDLHVDFGVQSELYPLEDREEFRQGYGNIDVKPSASYAPADSVTAKTKLSLLYDPTKESKNERNWVDVPEAYLQFRPTLADNLSASITGGLNTFTWGVTDGFNPLDVVNSKRYWDPINSEKIGTPSLELNLDYSSVSFQGLYIPKQRRSFLPGEASRWLPREGLQSQVYQSDFQRAEIIPPSTPTFRYQNDVILEDALDNNFGIKLEGHLPSLDLSAAYFSGAGNLPSTLLGYVANTTVIRSLNDVTVQIEPQISVTPVFYRQEVVGGSAVLALNELIVKGEVAFTRMLNSHVILPGQSKEFNGLPGRTQEYVLELEHEIPIGSGKLNVILEGTYAQHPDAPSTSTVSLQRIFDRAALLNLRYMPSLTFTASYSILYDTVTYGTMNRMELSYALTDTWKVVGTGEYLQGKESTPLGTYHKNSRMALSMRWSL